MRLLSKKAAIFALMALFLAKTSVFAQEQHPDKNIKLRGWRTVVGQLGYFDFEHPLDPLRPQLTTLVEGVRQPPVTSLHRVYKWNWEANQPQSETETIPDAPPDYANLIGFNVEGKNILVPESGYTLGSGFEVFVLYADEDSITLKYTCDDDVVIGYTLHLIGLQVDPKLVNLYRRLDREGRQELPILKPGAIIGTGQGEMLVSIRDSGAFLDARWRNDWWDHWGPTQGKPLELNSLSVNECGGGPTIYGCENPLDGPKESGCYRGAVVQNTNPVRRIINGILNAVFRWGGEDQKIEITQQKIPVEGDLSYLLGQFPLGAPTIIDESAWEAFRDGVLPKLTPPGEQLRTLQEMLPSYLGDYVRVETEVNLEKAPNTIQKPQLSAPDIWGLANSAVRLAFNLVKPPGEVPPAYAFKTRSTIQNEFAGQVLSRQNLACKIKEAESQLENQETIANLSKGKRLEYNLGKFTSENEFEIELAQSDLACPSTEAPEKPLCLQDENNEALFEEVQEPLECTIRFEREVCQYEGQEICLNSPYPFVCTAEDVGTTVNCVIPNQCPSTSTSGVSFNPKVAYLPDYTNYIIDTYSIFKTPGLTEKILFGESKEFEWTIGGQPVEADDRILYPKLGTVECLENYVKRRLAPPGHDIPEKEGCFE